MYTEDKKSKNKRKKTKKGNRFIQEPVKESKKSIKKQSNNPQKERITSISKSEKTGLFHNLFRKRTRRLLTDIDRLFTKIMWIELGISILIIIIGTLFLLNPEFSIVMLSILIGISFLGFGCLNIFSYMKRRELQFFRFYLIYGILGVLVGILTILNPFTFSQLITFFIGLWILYLAATKIDLAFRLKVISERSWSFLLATSFLEIGMSLIIIINPFSNLAITQISGSFLILIGILNSTTAVMEKNRSIDFLEDL